MEVGRKGKSQGRIDILYHLNGGARCECASSEVFQGTMEGREVILIDLLVPGF